MNDPLKPRVHPLLVLLLGIIAVSTASIFIRFAQNSVPSIVIAVYRLVIATGILAPICLLKNREEFKKLTAKDWLLLSASGIFLGFHFAAWITSLEYTSVASSVVLVTTTPLWVGLLAGIILHEKITPQVWIGLVIALLGSFLVATSQPNLDTWFSSISSGIKPMDNRLLQGNFLALLGALMAACYLLIGRSVRSRISLLVYIFIIYGFAAITVVVMAKIQGHPLLAIDPKALIWLILLAIIPQLLGHSSFNWALRYLPASFVSITMLGEPIGTIILAFIILGESPNILEMLGAGLIFSGIVFASRKMK